MLSLRRSRRALCRSRRAALPGSLLLGAALLCGPAARPAHAWNATGHMTIAQIAWRSLSPAAKAQVTDLLTHSVSYASWMRQMPAGYPDRNLYAFMRAATWPDDIRKSAADRPAWHYIDLPLVQKTALYNPGPDITTPVVPNAETELANQTYVLGLVHAAPADRAASLCWVEHLTGDLSQPLHCASLFSPVFTLGDKGGNSIQLSPAPHLPDVAGVPAFPASAYAGHSDPPAADTAPPDPSNLPPTEAVPRPPRNLHALWDDLLGGSRDPADIDKIAAFLQTIPYSRSAFPQIAAHTTIHSWVQEGSALAVKFVYLNGALPQSASRTGPASGPNAKTYATLPDGYIPAAQLLAEKQIALAGLRLADTLNATLGRPSPPREPAQATREPTQAKG